MSSRFRPTLAQAFAVAALVVALLLGLLFYRLLEGSRRSVLDASELVREEASKRIGDRVQAYLAEAEAANLDVEKQLRYGNVRLEDPLPVEAVLFARVLANDGLEEVTFTRGEARGFQDDETLRLAEDGRWQVSVFRDLEGEQARILTRRVAREDGRWRAWRRSRPPGGRLLDGAWIAGDGEDPTEARTFRTTSQRRFVETGAPVWTDLHFSDRDAALPESRRRVVVTVMKDALDEKGGFLGVLRAGLSTVQLDAACHFRMAQEGEDDPHRTFLCDDEGRLVTHLAPGDPLGEEPDTSLRVHPRNMPPEIALALQHPALKRVGPAALQQSGELEVAGRRYLVSFRGLPETQGWRVGIVVPEDHYTGALQATRRELLEGALVLIAAIAAAGLLILRAVRGALGRIVDSTGRMRNFDFAPGDPRSPFRDVQAVMERLELAKTAMRAMGKYVPIDLVRLLYQSNREPVLGGELADVTVMFTDIKDFTSLAERLSPNELARVLGRYLEVMTTAIQRTSGTIDKYIGDAVMAVWNVPTPCTDHALRACEAALACHEAAATLFASPEWAGAPHLHTRFGIHRDEVLVGHFGAPDRMSYTALGDGVNLASRLEGLNKQYGTTILVSETVHAAAAERFAFRRLDRVAVKGKSRGVEVFELLGDAGRDPRREQTARAYEDALAAYFARDFPRAVAALESLAEADEPSRVLLARSRDLLAAPPPPDWDGVYVSRSK